MCVRVCVLALMFISKETLNYSERLKQAQLPAGWPRKREDTSQDRPKNTKQSQMRSPEEYTPASSGKKEARRERNRGGRGRERERKRGMKNEALKQTGLRQQRALPTRPSLGDTLGILGNAVRHATAHWPPDWLL